MKQDIIILAGGFGTRLLSVLKDTPKPMALISEKPFLHYLFKQVEKYGFNHIILSTGYLSESISDYFGKKLNDITIDYAIEKNPLGTGGGILNAMQFCHSDDVFIMNGDTYFDIDFRKLHQHHTNNKADVSIALRKIEDCSRYGYVERNDKQRITLFGEKKAGIQDCFINGGTYLINRKKFQSLPLPSKFSMEKDVFEKYIHELNIYGYAFEDYFIDIGIPSDYKKAQDDFQKFEY